MGVTFPWLWPAASLASAHWSIREVTAPATEPITLAQAKVHLKIEASETYFDGDITGQIVAARQQVEKETSRFVARGTYDLAFDAAPNSGLFIFPIGGPISSITSVTAYDTEWAATALDADSYFLDSDSNPPRLILDTAAEDPAFEVELRDQRATVIRFVGGPDAPGEPPVTAASPAWACQAIYLLLELWRSPTPDPVVQAAYDRLIYLHSLVGVA